MKLINDYRVRISKWMYLMILPLVVYFFCFREIIYELVAGGIMFMYFTMMVMFANRYLKVAIQNQLAKRLGYLPEVYYKTLKPMVVPTKPLSSIDVQKIEGYPVLLTLSFNFLIALLLYTVLGFDYLGQIFFGGFILSFNINYRNVCLIVKSVQHPNGRFEYNTVSTKIYESIMNKEVIS